MSVWHRALNLTLWVLQGLTALVFLYFGAIKFDPREIFWVRLFAEVGIGQWFRYFTGGLEVICAILLLIPRASAIGAALLACTMVGAILTHVFVIRDPYASSVPAVLLLILVTIAWRRRAAPSR